MPVSLPRMCSVLAHELRSPLSVLQGYIRLLQRQRENGHPEAAMLEAMLDATGRLTTIAHQAAELGTWLTAPDLKRVPLASILDAVEQRRRPSAPVEVVRPASVPAAHVHADAPALADALVTLAESIARESGAAAVEISSSGITDDGAPVVMLRPRSNGTSDERPTGPPAPNRVLAFDIGGLGLALVAASHVLEAHGASVNAAASPGSIEVRLRDGGHP